MTVMEMERIVLHVDVDAFFCQVCALGPMHCMRACCVHGMHGTMADLTLLPHDSMAS